MKTAPTLPSEEESNTREIEPDEKREIIDVS